MKQKVGILLVGILIASAGVGRPVHVAEAEGVSAPPKERVKEFRPIAVLKARYGVFVKEAPSHLSRILGSIPAGAKLSAVGREKMFWKVLYGKRIAYVAATDVVVLRGKVGPRRTEQRSGQAK